MKNTGIFFLSAIGILCLLVCCSFSESSFNWNVPEQLLGEWKGNQKVKLRKKENGDYIFYGPEDSVAMIMNIAEKGEVTGKFGTAVFSDCRVRKNRGFLGRKLNIKTDYIIEGKLTGSIYHGDTLNEREFNLPFNLENGVLSGSFFPKAGIIEIYSIARVKLFKLPLSP